MGSRSSRLVAQFRWFVDGCNLIHFPAAASRDALSHPEMLDKVVRQMSKDKCNKLIE